MKLNLNAPFFQFINTAFDFVILNICFILTCLPVFTIGAALTALYTVTMAEAEDKGLPFTKNLFSYLYPVFYPVQSSVCRLHLHRCPASFLPVFLAFL